MGRPKKAVTLPEGSEVPQATPEQPQKSEAALRMKRKRDAARKKESQSEIPDMKEAFKGVYNLVNDFVDPEVPLTDGQHNTLGSCTEAVLQTADPSSFKYFPHIALGVVVLATFLPKYLQARKKKQGRVVAPVKNDESTA